MRTLVLFKLAFTGLYPIAVAWTWDHGRLSETGFSLSPWMALGPVVPSLRVSFPIENLGQECGELGLKAHSNFALIPKHKNED